MENVSNVLKEATTCHNTIRLESLKIITNFRKVHSNLKSTSTYKAASTISSLTRIFNRGFQLPVVTYNGGHRWICTAATVHSLIFVDMIVCAFHLQLGHWSATFVYVNSCVLINHSMC